MNINGIAPFYQPHLLRFKRKCERKNVLHRHSMVWWRTVSNIFKFEKFIVTIKFIFSPVQLFTSTEQNKLWSYVIFHYIYFETMSTDVTIFEIDFDVPYIVKMNYMIYAIMHSNSKIWISMQIILNSRILQFLG